MSDVPATESCPRCGAVVERGSRRCWQCGWNRFLDPGFGSQPARPVDQAVAGGWQPVTDSDVHDQSLRSFSLASLLLAITAIALLLAISVAAPGLGIVFAVFSIPPWVRTALLVQKRRRLGYETSHGNRILLYLGSMFMTWVVTGVVMFICAATFCGTCLAMATVASPSKPGQEQLLITTSLAVAGLAGLLTLAVAWRVIKWRWRMDVQAVREKSPPGAEGPPAKDSQRDS